SAGMVRDRAGRAEQRDGDLEQYASDPLGRTMRARGAGRAAVPGAQPDALGSEYGSGGAHTEEAAPPARVFARALREPAPRDRGLEFDAGGERRAMDLRVAAYAVIERKGKLLLTHWR